MRREFLICVLLAGLTLAAFWPAGRLSFIIFDDTAYVTQNPNVQAGITAQSIVWAFTTSETGNWHPLTWLSHMLDCRLFGLNAGGHHGMNVGLHVINVLLLFVLLRTTTGAIWRSAIAAALFAWHPLRLESVVWVSERKDVLSGFFFLLTLLCYASFAQKSEVRSQKSEFGNPASGYYWLALIFFALGLMSKPMLVTVPIILLLLDYWPLGRIAERGVRSAESKGTYRRLTLTALARRSDAKTAQLWALLTEKLPFLALSLASGIVTIWAQDQGGAISTLDQLPLAVRLANALAAYGSYLGKFFWPVNLSIFYPFTGVHAAAVLISAVLLAGVSAFCLWQARSRPCLLVGWCWFAVMLLPVIGLLQVGRQSLADRYTYLPSIGLSLLSVWGVAGWTAAGRFARAWLIAAAAAMLLGCFLDTRHQLRYWRDSITLLGHSLEVTPAKNCVGHWALGNAYLESGNLGAAVEHYHAALVIAPNFQEVHYQLGGVLLRQKKYAEAEAEFAEALRLNDHDFNAHLGLGHALVHQEKYAEAQAEYARALALKPDNAAAKQALVGATLKAEGEKALANFYDTLKVQPTPEIQVQIAAILTIQGKFQEAKEHYLAALQLKPDSPDVLNNLAWLLTTCPDPQVRDGAQAVRYAERACALTQSRETTLVGTLAAAYAEAGRFEDAVKTAGKACALASASGQPELLQKNQELLELYRRQQTYREMDNTNSIRAGSLK